MAEHDIKFEIEGLISLLAQNLYADPDVFLREMIQNAHDSIRKRQALAHERGERALPEPMIRVRPDPDAATLTIEDNGAGLTDEEIHKHLSTIGSSGTRELRRDLQARDRAAAVQLIGQFGIGLLSAFIVAERVEITTRSSAAGAPALRWESRGGKRYDLASAERDAAGTTVVLHLKPDHRRYLGRAKLHEIVQRYADFLGLPIHLGDETAPANAVDAPWHRTHRTPEERHAAFLLYWESRFKEERSLDVLPLDEAVTVPDPRPEPGKPAGFVQGRVRGVLGITDRHVPDVNTRGTVDVYVARMFVAGAHRELLPTWARFIQGVVECDVLTPNAARDNVVSNEAQAEVRRAIGERILAWLTAMSKDHPARFTDIMRWHAYHVLAMAVQDEHEAFFRAVADIVPLESDLGPLPMKAYLESAPQLPDGKRTVFYLTERGSATQYYVLCAARGLHVFNASEPFAERFLERYASTWPDRVHLARLDVTASAHIFTEIAADDRDRDRFRELEETYAALFPDLRCIAKVSRFRPPELPAVLTETRDQKTRREMEDVSKNVALPGFIRDLVKGFLKDKRDPLTLHVNADNPTIARLVKRGDFRGEVTRNALVALYNNAFLLLSRAITPENVQIMFQQNNKVLDLMLGLADERAALMAEREALAARVREVDGGAPSQKGTRPVTCFVAMPFTDPAVQPVFEALKEVLEDAPYGWDVVRADSIVKAGKLDENVRRHLAGASCFVAEISAENPSVMIEVGMMLMSRRPLLLLRRADAGPDLPVDLRGMVHETYAGQGRALVEQLRKLIAKHPDFVAQEGDKKLSETMLRSAAGDELAEKAIHKIASAFPTCRAFLDASTEETAQRLELRPPAIETAKACLRAHLDRAGRR
jgi:molecular chaperone HtpG